MDAQVVFPWVKGHRKEKEPGGKDMALGVLNVLDRRMEMDHRREWVLGRQMEVD